MTHRLRLCIRLDISECGRGMGKTKAERKAEKRGEGVQHRHVHSRISFLHQAAAYLSAVAVRTPTASLHDSHKDGSTSLHGGNHVAQSRQLLSQLREVSRKTNVRLTPQLKRYICKRCQCLLVIGSTSQESMTNASRGGRKAWADVFEIRCQKCGTAKRFPVGQKRRKDIDAPSTDEEIAEQATLRQQSEE
jgi:ribonuclease P protein subunit RPR2